MLVQYWPAQSCLSLRKNPGRGGKTKIGQFWSEGTSLSDKIKDDDANIWRSGKLWKNKEQEAKEEQEKLDAKIWLKKNREKLEQMDAEKCYEHLENQFKLRS